MPKCTCGDFLIFKDEVETDGKIHRLNGPCYVYETPEITPNQAAQIISAAKTLMFAFGEFAAALVEVGIQFEDIRAKIEAIPECVVCHHKAFEHTNDAGEPPYACEHEDCECKEYWAALPDPIPEHKV